MDKHLNIVAFDNPYPPTYGGVIDVYYKINALAKQGIKIHLHYYSNKKDIALELKNICDEIFIYNREKGLTKQFSKYPYIVLSRSSEELIKNLAKNNYPVLFEGLHTTY
ncbi:MAG: glycosyltransferase family 1 protein, partial [Bacteroidota bacterium]